MTATAYSTRDRDDLYLSQAQVRAFSDDELLERWEDLYDACLAERDPQRFARLRQSLDLLTKEGSGKRQLIRWTL